MGPIQKICRQLSDWQFDPDLGAAWPIGIGCRLDPVQARAQRPAQTVNGKTQSLPLSRQIKDQFFFVIGQRVLNSTHLGILQQSPLEIFGCSFECIRISTKKLYVQRIATRTRSPSAKANRFDQRMMHHCILQFGDKGERRIGPQISVYQFDRDAAKQVDVLAVGP